MPGLLESCDKYFGQSSLYDVLHVGKSASESEVKRGYHKLSLTVHPDRVTDADDKQEATEKFQILGQVYSILSDKDKRAVYDETGEVDDENDVSPDRDWSEYWRLLFPKITVDDIMEYEKKYKGSDEELDDLRSAYMDYEGNMDQILDSIPCATLDDEARFTKILKNLISKEELPDFKTFSKETKRKKMARQKRYEGEAKEAAEMADEVGLNGDDSLQALIKAKQQSRGDQMNSFLSDLEAKYCKKAPTKGKKTKKT